MLAEQLAEEEVSPRPSEYLVIDVCGAVVDRFGAWEVLEATVKSMLAAKRGIGDRECHYEFVQGLLQLAPAETTDVLAALERWGIDRREFVERVATAMPPPAERAAETLLALSGNHALIAASDLPHDLVEEYLRRHAIEHLFTTLECADVLGRLYTSPRAFYRLATRYPAAVYVSDNAASIDLADAAGLFVVHVTEKVCQCRSKHARSLAELPAALE